MVDRVGILAVQGNVQRHAVAIAAFGIASCAVKSPETLSACSHLIIPGGESSVLLHNLDEEFRRCIQEFARSRPVLGTCAGLILMASKVLSPEQESLSLLDVSVQRNGFGRQLASFITTDMYYEVERQCIEAVFIRAPRIIDVLSEDVCVLGSFQKEPVLIRQGNCLGATFHPELSTSRHPLLEYFLSMSETEYELPSVN